jgi:hypothetical protein
MRGMVRQGERQERRGVMADKQVVHGSGETRKYCAKCAALMVRAGARMTQLAWCWTSNAEFLLTRA